MQTHRNQLNHVCIVVSTHYVDIFVCNVTTMQMYVCVYSHNGACLQKVSEVLVQTSYAYIFLNHLKSSNFSNLSEKSISNISIFGIFLNSNAKDACLFKTTFI